MLSYLLDAEFEFWISGRWSNGGLLEICYDGYSVGGLRLPRVAWGVLAALAQQALRAESPTRAFMTAREILDVLRRNNVLQTRDPGRVVRLIHELRKGLNESQAKKFQTAWDGEQGKWGKRVIETSQLGYRLSLPPDRIHVEFLGPAPCDPPTNGSSGGTSTAVQRRSSAPTFPGDSGQTPFGTGVRR